MITPNQRAFLIQMYNAAKTAQHKWPAAAACEAVVETGWGEHIPTGSKNVLGIKAFNGWRGATVGASGTEQSTDGTWSGPQADRWCVFFDYPACFEEQMQILKEPRYAAAMAATTVIDYIKQECRVWSTGILKATEVLEVYAAHAADLGVTA